MRESSLSFLSFLPRRERPLLPGNSSEGHSIKCRCANSGMTGGRFSKSWGLSASVPFLSSPPPPRSFSCAIFRSVFDSRCLFFAPKPHGSTCYALPALFLAPLFARSLTFVPRSLLLNRTETLIMLRRLLGASPIFHFKLRKM